jgi:hypothetical protein
VLNGSSLCIGYAKKIFGESDLMIWMARITSKTALPAFIIPAVSIKRMSYEFYANFAMGTLASYPPIPASSTDPAVSLTLP